MKRFSPFFLLLFFLNVSIYAQEYRMKQTIVLKKDKTEKFLVKYGEIKKEFRFNWTLYQNSGLVVKTNYDRFNSQHMLYMNHVNQSIRIELRSISMQRRWLPYIIVKFVKFDTNRQEATFDLFLFDKKEQIEFTQPQKETPKA